MHAPSGEPAAAPPPPPPSAPVPALSGGLRVAAAIAVVAALAAAGLLASRKSRSTKAETTQRESDAAQGPVVRVATTVASAPSHHLVLLAEARPFASVTLYAKVSGYLKWIGVDKGDHVKADQVIAVVESPETDAAWGAAKADHAQKELTASRLKTLLDRKFASQEETDLAEADAAVAQQRLESLTQQREFENLHVPFNGTVTARYADPGALVQNAAANETAALPVVTVEDTDSLRVYAYFDQADAAAARVGLPAVLTMDDHPGLQIPAKIARTSGELDDKTRKLLVEFDVDDRKGVIVPGSFVHAELDVPAPVLPEMPSEALIVRSQRTFVAVLSPDSTVHFREVEVANDDGRRMRIVKGARIGDRVVVNGGDALVDGMRVRPSVDSTATKSGR